MKRVIGVALYAAYVIALASWLADVVGHLFLPWELGAALGIRGLLASPILVLGILAWTLWSPRSRWKWVGFATALVVGVVALNFYHPLRAMSDRLYVRQNHDEFEQLMADIRSYGRITSMTHGEEYLKVLNGTMVAFTEAGRDSVAFPRDRRPMLSTVLERDSIDREVYLDFGRRLRGLHFERFDVSGAVTTFRRDRDSGLAHVPPPLGPLAPGDAVPAFGFEVTRHVSGDWYYWWCCPSSDGG